MMRARPGTKPSAKAAIRPAQRVRIIGGQWKRTPLPVLEAEGLRPTPDRVRETVFNWLTHLLDGNWSGLRCLDLFAGTGALGFEAASRGAQQVLMVEDYVPAVRQLEATSARLGADQVRVRRGDAQVTAVDLVRSGAHFDLIFLDPPYHREWLVKILPECERLLAPGGLVYAESEFALDDAATPAPAWLSGWEVVRAERAGSVFYHLLRRNSTPGIRA
jgi:16S rRNA (guanine966-N2)-methyltransferase